MGDLGKRDYQYNQLKRSHCQKSEVMSIQQLASTAVNLYFMDCVIRNPDKCVYSYTSMYCICKLLYWDWWRCFVLKFLGIGCSHFMRSRFNVGPCCPWVRRKEEEKRNFYKNNFLFTIRLILNPFFRIFRGQSWFSQRVFNIINGYSYLLVQSNTMILNSKNWMPLICFLE